MRTDAVRLGSSGFRDPVQVAPWGLLAAPLEAGGWGSSSDGFHGLEPRVQHALRIEVPAKAGYADDRSAARRRVPVRRTTALPSVREDDVMSKSEPHLYLVHPAFAPQLVDARKLPLPLTESRLPPEWVAAGEEIQERHLRMTWNRVIDWLRAHGANRVVASVPAKEERRLLLDGPFTTRTGSVVEADATNSALALILEVNPESVRVMRGDVVLSELYDTWDGLVICTTPDDLPAGFMSDEGRMPRSD